MGLSKSFIEAHIAAWQQKLTGPFYPYRAKWPRYLFHHAPLENAVSILNSGQLLSRNDSDRLRVRDVAAPGVIDTSHRAHRFVRFYFRPRTPTQYHIEGIRKPGECKYGDVSHAPVLIMLVFDARDVLCAEETCFSSSNMQKGEIEQSAEADFMQIPFEKVYHEGGIASDSSIIGHRCAEVLAPSPMDIGKSLKWVYCRSEAERTTLVQELGEVSDGLLNKIKVSDDLRVFEKRFAFVDSVFLSAQGVAFKLNPRRDSLGIFFELKAFDHTGICVIDCKSENLPSNSPLGGGWIAKAKLKAGMYRVQIRLEKQLAYDAKLKFDLDPF